MQEKIIIFSFIAALIIAIKNLVIQCMYIDTSPYKIAINDFKNTFKKAKEIKKRRREAKRCNL